MSEHIPGIFSLPEGIPEGQGIKLIGFDLKMYEIPEAHRYGNCRLITEFEKISCIGEGSYGTYYKVKERQTKDLRILKKLRFTSGSKELPLNCLREIVLLESFSHKNISRSYGVAVGRNFDSAYIILEYFPYGLSKVLEDGKKCSLWGPPEIKVIMLQLFNGLDYLHKRNIIHRDIAPNNIKFSAEGILKITDFGDARKDDSENEKTPKKVTLWYRAPELLFGSMFYSCPVDIWAAGCIFAELLLKKPLFAGESECDMIALLVHVLGTPDINTWPDLYDMPIMKEYELMEQPVNRLQDYLEGHLKPAVDLLSMLLLYNQHARLDAEGALEQPYCIGNKPPVCHLQNLLWAFQSSPQV